MIKRIFRSVFLVAFSVMLVVSGLLFHVMYDYASLKDKKALKREAAFAAEGVEREGIGFLNAMEKNESRVTWIKSDGTVLFDSEANASDMENHSTREEVREALEKGEGSGERHSITLSEKTLYHARRLSDGSVIRVSVETLSRLSVLMTMAQPLVMIFVIMMAVSFFLSYKTARLITKPVNEIDLEHPDRAEVYEELTPLLHRIAVQNKEIRRQMTELKRRKEEFDTITRNMQEGLLVLDNAGNILSYNQGIQRLLGVDEIAEGQNVYSLERSQGFREGVEGALSGGHREERIEKNGRVCQLFANPVCREDEITGAILILFDTTETEERERLRRQFTANVSHELKTPLTSISGFAEIMKSGMVKPCDMERFSGKIYEEAQRLIVMVQDIIRLSRLDENAGLPEKEPVPLKLLAEETVKRLESAAEREQVKLSCSAEPVVFLGVKQVLAEMMYNLCDNAIRYNCPNGTAELRVFREAEQVHILVKDTGIGIPKKEQKRIFERFYRLEESRSQEKGGTGLGLSIVKHGAALHGGVVRVRSEQGEGTEMDIILCMKQTEKDGNG